MTNNKIYIVLSMSGTRFSKFLRLFSKIEYPHVSLSLSPNLSTMYSFGRQNLKRPWIAGFVEEHKDTGVYEVYNAKCEILEVSISVEQYEKISEILEHDKKHYKEFKYNFSGLIFTYLKVPRKLTKKYTCTQFVATVLKEARVLSLNKDPSLVLPTDYYKLPHRKIYSGYLSEYCMA